MESHQSVVKLDDINHILLELSGFPERVRSELGSIWKKGPGYSSDIRFGGNMVGIHTFREYKSLQEVIKNACVEREMRPAPCENYEEAYSPIGGDRKSFVLLRPWGSKSEVATIETYLELKEKTKNTFYEHFLNYLRINNRNMGLLNGVNGGIGKAIFEQMEKPRLSHEKITQTLAKKTISAAECLKNVSKQGKLAFFEFQRKDENCPQGSIFRYKGKVTAPIEEVEAKLTELLGKPLLKFMSLPELWGFVKEKGVYFHWDDPLTSYLSGNYWSCCTWLDEPLGKWLSGWREKRSERNPEQKVFGIKFEGSTIFSRIFQMKTDLCVEYGIYIDKSHEFGGPVLWLKDDGNYFNLEKKMKYLFYHCFGSEAGEAIFDLSSEKADPWQEIFGDRFPKLL